MWAAVVAAALAPVALAATLTGDVPLIVPPASAAMPSFSLALDDVARDWYAVLGVTPITLRSLPTNSSIPKLAADARGLLVVVGTAAEAAALVPQGRDFFSRLGQPESHGCCLVPAVSSGAQVVDVLACVGADALGAVYALYQLSHDVLGVDPQHYFTDHAPPYRGEVPLIAPSAQQCAVQKPGGDGPLPGFRYRGFFVNDEDLLSGLGKDPARRSVFSAALWNRVFELVLRLRGNAVIVGTVGYVDEEVRGASARRLLRRTGPDPPAVSELRAGAPARPVPRAAPHHDARHQRVPLARVRAFLLPHQPRGAARRVDAARSLPAVAGAASNVRAPESAVTRSLRSAPRHNARRRAGVCCTPSATAG